MGFSLPDHPDSLFINGPEQVGFDTVKFVDEHPGWLKNIVAFAAEKPARWEIIDFVATNYSVSRACAGAGGIEANALSDSNPGGFHVFGKIDSQRGFYRQPRLGADVLNKGYYDYRAGKLLSFEHLDGRLNAPTPGKMQPQLRCSISSHVQSGDDYTRHLWRGIAKPIKSCSRPWPIRSAYSWQPRAILTCLCRSNQALPGLSRGPHNNWGEEDAPCRRLILPRLPKQGHSRQINGIWLSPTAWLRVALELRS